MIEVDRLTKRYGPVPAIEDVSFTVEKGQIVGFLGPNGAGKTTTMRILSCFMPASSGTARVAGYDVFEQSLEVRRRIGYMPENVPLYGDMTVAAYLDFVAHIKGLGRSERRRRVGEVLERCQIPDVRERLIGRLSKGYRQRVGLAQALIADPEVLILDEPTIGLDPKQIIEIRRLIKELASDRTVILSTHILPEVSQLCNKVVIINDGTMVVEKQLKELAQGESLEAVFLRYISKEATDGDEAAKGVAN
jgi:ABC-2 type transport system ATP-binding protein